MDPLPPFPPPPPVNSWTPRIPGKFWTKKKPKTNIKKSWLFSRRWACHPPPPLSLTKNSGSAHALTIQPLFSGLTPCQKELYGYVCTLAELSTNHRGPHGGGGEAEINLFVPPKSTIYFPPTFSLFACSPQKLHKLPLFP